MRQSSKRIISFINLSNGTIPFARGSVGELMANGFYNVPNITSRKTSDTSFSVSGFKTSLLIIFRVDYKVNEEGAGLKYNISSPLLLPILVAILVGCALFSSFSVTQFLWFSLSFAIVYLVVFYWQARLLATSIFRKRDVGDDFSINEQQAWVNDVTRCPGCGNFITKYQHTCDECGLVLRDKQTFSRFNHTGMFKKFTYIYKTKEN